MTSGSLRASVVHVALVAAKWRVPDGCPALWVVPVCAGTAHFVEMLDHLTDVFGDVDRITLVVEQHRGDNSIGDSAGLGGFGEQTDDIHRTHLPDETVCTSFGARAVVGDDDHERVVEFARVA